MDFETAKEEFKKAGHDGIKYTKEGLDFYHTATPSQRQQLNALRDQARIEFLTAKAVLIASALGKGWKADKISVTTESFSLINEYHRKIKVNRCAKRGYHFIALLYRAGSFKDMGCRSLGRKPQSIAADIQRRILDGYDQANAIRIEQVRRDDNNKIEQGYIWQAFDRIHKITNTETVPRFITESQIIGEIYKYSGGNFQLSLRNLTPEQVIAVMALLK